MNTISVFNAAVSFTRYSPHLTIALYPIDSLCVKQRLKSVDGSGLEISSPMPFIINAITLYAYTTGIISPMEMLQRYISYTCDMIY
jgi:hypothetical protein